MPEFDLKDVRLLIKAGIPIVILVVSAAIWLWNQLRSRLNPEQRAAEANARGQMLMTHSDMAGAEKEFTNAIEASPSCADLFYNRASVRIRLMKLTEAISDLKQAIQLAPQDAQLHYKLAVAYKQNDQLSKAVACYDEAIRLRPHDALYFLARGAVFQDLSNNDAAMQNYNRALELEPDMVLARSNRAAIYRDRRQFQEALQDYNHILQVDPRHDATWNLRGNLHFELDATEKAIEDYSRAIEAQPDSAVYYSNRAHALRDSGQFREALRDFETSLQLNPKYSHAQIGRGWAFYRVKNFAAALQDFDQTIANDAADVSGWVGRSNVLLKLGHHAEAMAAGEKATEINPTVGLFARGLARLAAGSYEAGFRDFREHQRLNPRDPFAANRIGWLRSSLESPDARNPAEAVQYAELACQMTSFRNPAFVDTLAAAYADAGRFDDAVRRQTQAIELLAASGIGTTDYQSRLMLYRIHTPYRASLIELI